MPASASPAKLRDGSWGARVTSTSVNVGDEVKIATKSGKSWTAIVSRVIWSGDGITLVATQSTDRAPSRGYARRSGEGYCGYPFPVSGRRCTQDDPCHDCQ